MGKSSEFDVRERYQVSDAEKPSVEPKFYIIQYLKIVW